MHQTQDRKIEKRRSQPPPSARMRTTPARDKILISRQEMEEDISFHLTYQDLEGMDLDEEILEIQEEQQPPTFLDVFCKGKHHLAPLCLLLLNSMLSSMDQLNLLLAINPDKAMSVEEKRSYLENRRREIEDRLRTSIMRFRSQFIKSEVYIFYNPQGDKLAPANSAWQEFYVSVDAPTRIWQRFAETSRLAKWGRVEPATPPRESGIIKKDQERLLGDLTRNLYVKGEEVFTLHSCIISSTRPLILNSQLQDVNTGKEMTCVGIPAFSGYLNGIPYLAVRVQFNLAGSPPRKVSKQGNVWTAWNLALVRVTFPFTATAWGKLLASKGWVESLVGKTTTRKVWYRKRTPEDHTPSPTGPVMTPIGLL